TMTDQNGTISDFGLSKPFFLIQSSKNIFLPRKSHTLPVTRKFTIGRSRNSDLVLDNQHISSSHAQLSWNKNQWILSDNGSTNGTFLNGERIKKQAIVPDDVITFGTCPIRLKLTEKPPPSLKPLILLIAGFALGIGSFYFMTQTGQNPEVAPGSEKPQGTTYQITPQEQLQKPVSKTAPPAKPANISPAPVTASAPARHESFLSYQPLPILNFNEMLYNQVDKTTLYRYSINPDVYILDFPSLYIQGRSMNRIMALIEDVRAPKDRVLSEFEFEKFLKTHALSTESFNLGHDYTSHHLTQFFKLTQQHGIALRPEEKQLKALLVKHGLINNDLTAISEQDKKVIISITQQTIEFDKNNNEINVTLDTRKSVLRHELSHGEFFSNPSYREYAENFWNNEIPDYLRRRIGRFLTDLGYDISDKILTINEMQAFLFHTDHESIFSAQDIGITVKELHEIRKRFFEGLPNSLFMRDLQS
ncbi:MAG: FHA domain-containing protein, partial [Gammaproteobacteria bacterium]|nr:FHA domain-containing protein [Gammaproteobacteria bacterium]